MNSVQITKILSNNNLTKTVFRGVYACDVIPSIDESTYAIIVNTDNSSKPGSHWILLYVTDQTIYFYDSYGRNINSDMFPKDFTQYIAKFVDGKTINYNSQIIQGLTSNVCAQHCMYFLFEKCLHVKNILKPFGANLHENDLFVTRFVKNM